MKDDEVVKRLSLLNSNEMCIVHKLIPMSRTYQHCFLKLLFFSLILIGITESFSLLNACSLDFNASKEQNPDSSSELSIANRNEIKFRFEDYKTGNELRNGISDLEWKIRKVPENVVNVLKQAGAKCEYISPKSIRCIYTLKEGSHELKYYVDIIINVKNYSIFCAISQIGQNSDSNTGTALSHKGNNEFSFRDYMDEKELTTAFHSLFPSGSDAKACTAALRKAGAECRYLSPGLIYSYYEYFSFLTKYKIFIEIFVDNRDTILSSNCELIWVTL